MAGYVLDTSAIMAVILAESGAEDAHRIIHGPERVTAPFSALMEVEYRLRRINVAVASTALEMIGAWPVAVAESYYDWRRVAAEIKSQGKLSLADAWVAALALMEDAELVHKDPEFDSVPDLKALRLPYDRDQRRRTT